jgi:hypothetical protein
MMRFRSHRGSLADSLETVCEFETFDDLARIVRSRFKTGDAPITVKPYTYDERIKWDTHIVEVEGFGPVGFTDGPVRNAMNQIKELADRITLEMTCSACPEQYDATLEGARVGYLRLRHGYFRVDYPECGERTILEGYPRGDGIFEDDERDEWLSKAKLAIANAILNGPESAIPNINIPVKGHELSRGIARFAALLVHEIKEDLPSGAAIPAGMVEIDLSIRIDMDEMRRLADAIKSVVVSDVRKIDDV